MPLRYLWPLSLMLLLLTISGCGTSQPSKFYLLNASNTAVQSSGPSLTIGLGPIQFPTYLERNKILVRTSNNSFKAAEYHRWAEPLETNFTRVLAQALNNALPNTSITIYPWRSSQKIETQIVLEVLSFDSDSQNQASLTVRWALIDANKNTLIPPKQHTYTQRADKSDYDARVAAMSDCVTQLGAALAQAIAHSHTP